MRKCFEANCAAWLENHHLYCHDCGVKQFAICGKCHKAELIYFVLAGICQEEADKTKEAFFVKCEESLHWWQKKVCFYIVTAIFFIALMLAIIHTTDVANTLPFSVFILRIIAIMILIIGYISFINLRLQAVQVIEENFSKCYPHLAILFKD